ncbi:glycerol-3-phosphate 1-O-acyltransferase PlsY [Staphylococcus intermedius]|uniref:Glycerol-3-phosphate acyltransferase n=1 Tax=Staphylococcus intermedius NCTC 11048 TaxID=1141106 RepID=A0A380G956_STAIN|nr:glycerol-3-phosphate 1-O-acyltransferase PlsY [Staphylococcus intermedius]PCF64973.1 acyl-phosphate glycerol 3-phosphate acyltransferase [Staphylococcus intermedius]PCF80584.1 acyl-phosphate glycerol 3-phosphate acyltransferase [Staphylococcus intermedius]PCF81933.1 acyl-phosphate glycerol 3-phosphate acyltransferase [Staphylococcus intermedius]PCF88269.1 acyl-phosphate glycerol 3-phosphate acyltransferase [Staphylococcus intermedius]PCF88984.1 acyl-phosphate glycerol 3-phosphate acyltransf
MVLILLFIVSYLIGSIPSGYLIGKIFFKKDIREYGSGNTGATNSFRVLGKPAGFAVTFFDIFKGFIVVFLPVLFNVEIHGLLVGIFAILGHVYPIYLKFRGGKAVATSAGVLLAVNPILLLILAAIFFIILKLTKYVSLSSIIAAICCVIGSFFVSDYIMLFTSFVVAILLIYRHMSNIKRIIKGTEPKIKWM